MYTICLVYGKTIFRYTNTLFNIRKMSKKAPFFTDDVMCDNMYKTYL